MSRGEVKKEKPATDVEASEKSVPTPSGWEWCRLTDTGEYINGLAFKPSDWCAEGLPIIRIQNLSGRNPEFNRTLGQFDRSVIVDPGDILVSWSATLDAYVWQGERGVLNQHIFRVEPSPCVDRAFLFWLLKWAIRDLARSDHAHGLVMSHINRGPFLAKPVLLPPLPEQARIVARVDELMRLCDSLEAKGRLEAEQHARLLGALLGTLTDVTTPEELAANWQRVAEHFDLLLDRPEAVDALEQAILQMAVRGLLVRQDPTEEPASRLLQAVRADRPGQIGNDVARVDRVSSPINEAETRFALPAGWTWARLSEISNVIVDCPHSTAKFVDAGLFLCLDTNSFKDGRLLPHKLRFVSQETFEERIARLRPEPGDLVFAREGSVGESLIIPPGTVCCLGQRVMLFRLSTRVSNEFVRLAITTRDFLDSLLSLHKGIGAKHVNVGDMRNAVVPIPPFREQQRILARVTELRRLCDALRHSLTSSQTTQTQLAEALVAEVAWASPQR